MESFVRFVSLVTFATYHNTGTLVSTQQFQSEWSSEELQVIPCYGQEMTNGSFHVGKIQYTSEQIYYYDQIFQGNTKNNLDCTFNRPGTSSGIRFGSGPYTWNIDRIDIVSSGGMDCLGGGVGYPWYRFRLYGLSYTEYQASIWITWRGSSAELTANPAYLVQCVYEGTNEMARPINPVF